MNYRIINYLIIFLLLDILAHPPQSFNSRKEVRGQTENITETTEQKKYVSEDGIVHLENEMDIIDLIKAVSEITGEAYVIDSSVKPGKVSIITPEGGMRKEDVLIFFDTILRLNGLAVINADGINKVVNSSDISGHGTPVESD
ncbi:MAG: hypothetical protein RIG61_09275 [Deltaproteobacteria bacterium]